VAAPRFPIQAADGWKVVKLAQGLTTPRDIVVDKKNNLLVIENGKGLSVHTFGPDGCIASSKLIINNGQLNHGLDMAPDGETIYVSSQTTVWRYKYDDETQTVSDATVVIKNMWSGGHPTRALTVPPKTPNLLVVQLGSNANFDMQAILPETARALVKVFDVGGAPAGGWDYIKEGSNLGYGLRNEVALVPDGNNM
jgi:glucose/arabinose dehydrogenase